MTLPTIAAPTAPGTLSIQRSAQRARFDHGWLQTSHSFSFAGYTDPANEHWGALRVFNDDVVAPGRGFGAHPHRDMEILTYVLEGELEHEDSLGNAGVVTPGGVQYVSAGTGLRHSEVNHSAERPVHFVQMWVLPQAAGLTPRYGQVDYTLDERLDRWLPIASGRADVTAKIAIWQDAAAYVARVERATLTHRIETGRFGFAFVASGEATIDGKAVHAGDAARIAGPLNLSVAGHAELVLWDVPALDWAS